MKRKKRSGKIKFGAAIAGFAGLIGIGAFVNGIKDRDRFDIGNYIGERISDWRMEVAITGEGGTPIVVAVDENTGEVYLRGDGGLEKILDTRKDGVGLSDIKLGLPPGNYDLENLPPLIVAARDRKTGDYTVTRYELEKNDNGEVKAVNGRNVYMHPFGSPGGNTRFLGFTLEGKIGIQGNPGLAILDLDKSYNRDSLEFNSPLESVYGFGDKELEKLFIDKGYTPVLIGDASKRSGIVRKNGTWIVTKEYDGMSKEAQSFYNSDRTIGEWLSESGSGSGNGYGDERV